MNMTISTNCEIVHFANIGCSAIGKAPFNDPQVRSSKQQELLFLLREINLKNKDDPSPQKKYELTRLRYNWKLLQIDALLS